MGLPATRLRIQSLWGEIGTLASLSRYALRLPSTLRQVRRLVRRHGIAVINAHFPRYDAAGLLLLRRLGLIQTRIILSFHGSDIRTALQAGGAKRGFYRWMLGEADHVVACSQGLMEEIEMLQPDLRARSVIHNGMGAAPNSGRPAAVREPGTSLIVSVGKFDWRKGHDLLIAAFREVAADRPSLRLWILGGTGADLGKIRALAAHDPRIRLFVDVPHDQVLPTVAQADVFALASRWRKGEYGEGHPICLLEAGSAGVPVVSTRSCGVREMITPDVHGKLVELENAGQLAEALRGVLDDRTAAMRMAEAFRRRIARDLTWEKAWRQYEALASG